MKVGDGAIIFLPIGVLIGGLLLWLASKIVDARIAFAAAMMIVTYSQIQFSPMQVRNHRAVR